MKSNEKVVLAHFDSQIEADFMVSFLKSCGLDAWSVGNVVNMPGYSDPRVLVFKTDFEQAKNLVRTQYTSEHKFEEEDESGRDWDNPDSFDGSKEMPVSSLENFLQKLNERHIFIFFLLLLLGVALLTFLDRMGPR